MPSRIESVPPVASENAAVVGLEEKLSYLSLAPVEELQSEDQKCLLDVVDSLRALDVGGSLPLPQLVVCGGQSTGKSSVLEAISGVPFPRGESLCTRFASEIELRRAHQKSIIVSVQPAPGRTEAERKRFQAFSRKLDSFATFKSIIEEAKTLMGLKAAPNGAGTAFSRDILHVKYHGPTNPHLTIVDLPGIIQATTDKQSQDDIQVVDDLIKKYMDNPQSIILAVVTATTDWENQAVVERAKKVDYHGKRTLGIITKIDLVRRGSKDERKWASLAQNRDRVLGLGWHVVKNADTADHDDSSIAEGRDAQEMAFFQDSPFQSDTASNLGVGRVALVQRLSHILLRKCQGSLGPLRTQTEEKIQQYEAEAARLGVGRPEIQDQRNFLNTISLHFHTVCLHAILGNYNEHPFLRDDKASHLRLCAVVKRLSQRFAYDLYHHGSKWSVDDFNVAPGSEPSNPDSELSSEEDAKSVTDIEKATDMACEMIKANTGHELPGHQNAVVTGKLFMEYSEPWQKIAERHIRDVGYSVNLFAAELLVHLTDENTAASIREWLSARLEQNVKDGQNELKKLLKTHQHPQTNNPKYLTEWNSVKKLAEQALQATDTQGMQRVFAKEAIATMQIYYRIARDTFVDNVPALTIWSPIVYALLEAFSPDSVSQMSDDLVSKLAAEPTQTIARRAELEADLKLLTRARDEFESQIMAHRVGMPPPRRVAATRSTTPAPMIPSAMKTAPTSSPTSSPVSSYSPSVEGSTHSAASINTAATTPSPSPGRLTKVHIESEVPRVAISQHLSPEDSVPTSTMPPWQLNPQPPPVASGFTSKQHNEASPTASPQAKSAPKQPSIFASGSGIGPFGAATSPSRRRTPSKLKHSPSAQVEEFSDQEEDLQWDCSTLGRNYRVRS